MNLVEKLIEVKIAEEEDFLKIKETLTRMGIASRIIDENEKKHKLFQSCHILHKQGKYYITHFKEMFLLDGKPSNFTEEDKIRRDTIITLLQKWGLIQIVEPEKLTKDKASVKVVSFKEKNNWILEPKYNIGRKKRPQ